MKLRHGASIRQMSLGWLVGLAVGQLFGRSVSCLVGRLVVWSVGWSVDLFVSLSVGWLVGLYVEILFLELLLGMKLRHGASIRPNFLISH